MFSDFKKMLKRAVRLGFLACALFILLIISVNTVFANLDTENVAYYKEDGNFNDTYNVYNPAFNNATYNTSGKINGGYTYNGVVQWTALPNITNLNTTKGYTINLWVYWFTIGSKRVAHSYGSGNTRYWQIDTTASGSVITTDVRDVFGNGTTVTAYGYATLNTWKMLTLTVNGTNTSLYINGSYVNSTNNTNFSINNMGLMTANLIGSAGGSAFHNGSIDEIGIWNRSLTQSEITTLYNSYNGLQPPFLPSTSADQSFCYQESSNTSNQSGTDGNCGLNYTGGYANISDSTAVNGFDGNYFTYFSTGIYLVRYVKPANVGTSNLWMIKDYLQSFNYTIPDDCYNYNSTQINLLVNVGKQGLSYYNNYFCYNSTWKLLNSSSGISKYYFYEEGIYWNITKNITFNFKDQITGNVITDPITITIQNNNTYLQYTSSNGVYEIYNLSNDIFNVYFTSQNYTNQSLQLNTINSPVQSINVRLLQSNISILTSVYVKSSSYISIENAVITIQRQYSGGSYATVLQCISDINGYCQFNVQQGTSYRVIVSASDYSLKQFDFSFYYGNNPYTWLLTDSNTGNFINFLSGTSYYYTPMSLTLNQSNYNFSITTYNSNYTIVWTAVNTNGTIVNVSGSVSGGTASNSVNLTSFTGVFNVTYSFNYFDPNTNTYQTYFIPVYYIVPGNNTFYPGTSNSSFIDMSKAFNDEANDSVMMSIIAVFISIVAVVITTQLSNNNIAGAFVGLGFEIGFAFLGWISVPIVVISGVVMVILLFINR